ncbi:MAG: hypothetical protein K6G15_11745 [Desulfovibrio sp.]|nr:hypothetical protein [Desulfovibrio sp.]
MRVLLAIAGFITLCAIIWCFKTMKSGFTTLSADKERFRQKFRDEELRLSKEQRDISSSEQYTLLEAAVRDLLRLEERTDCELTRQADQLQIRCQEKCWIISFHHHRQELKSASRVLHGPGVWSLREGDSVEQFPGIDRLMCAFQKRLRGQSDAEELNMLEENDDYMALRRKHLAQKGKNRAQ